MARVLHTILIFINEELLGRGTRDYGHEMTIQDYSSPSNSSPSLIIGIQMNRVTKANLQLDILRALKFTDPSFQLCVVDEIGLDEGDSIVQDSALTCTSSSLRYHGAEITKSIFDQIPPPLFRRDVILPPLSYTKVSYLV